MGEGDHSSWLEDDAIDFMELMLRRSRKHGVVFYDAERRITGWNEGAYFITGWTAREALGQSTALTFVPEDVERGIDELEATTAAAIGAAEDERWHRRKDGSRF